ncbi:MAG: hypothetical protein K2X27_26145 [Candidatus Obscuribacterales bacterium]|nr:hypothetical protein [Candidatus Obscuribacterales bacterium]
MIWKCIKRFTQEEDGQGITEYACVLAFVCLLVLVVFEFSQGSLAFALSQSVSSMVGQLDRLNLATDAANAT